MAKTTASLQAFPSSLLPSAWSCALIPFPFPFERLPRRLAATLRQVLQEEESVQHGQFEDATPALRTLVQTPTAAHIDGILPTIERFLILMYDKEIPDDSVNKARQTLFTQKGREIDKIPRTKDALRQHVIRAAYQAGHVWGQALLKAPQLPSPEEFGWKRENASAQWEVKWTNLPPAGAACRAVVKCRCVKGCRRQRKCVKENLPRTLLCKCGGCQRHE